MKEDKQKSGFTITEVCIVILLAAAIAVTCFAVEKQRKTSSTANAAEVVTQRGTAAKKTSADTRSEIKPITRSGQCYEAVKNFNTLGGLRKTFYPDVYCTNLGLGPGKYERQEHYICNRRTGKLVKLPNIYYVTSSGTDRSGQVIDVEELQVSVQNYNYTTRAGVYEKDGQLYKYGGNGKFILYK